MNASENSEVIAKGEINVEDFGELYELAMSKTLQSLTGRNSSELEAELANKRAVGLKKYGKDSFQSSFHNALNSPTLDHAMDELRDCMNYLLHEMIFKAPMLYPSKSDEFKKLFSSVYSVYCGLSLIKGDVRK